MQFVFAGNDSEGLRYGAIGTEEKYFLSWKEDEADDSRFKLDKYLLKMCVKDRFIELMHDFVLFDGGMKKLPRVHQHFAVKAAQARVRAGQGGIIRHTQGSGKSIVMVLLAKWILENLSAARVLIVTDRDEPDKQIEGVFTEAGEAITRPGSGSELMRLLGKAKPRLLRSLVHKFGRRDVDDFDGFIRDLESQPPVTVGSLFVFVDECHRTQSGKLHGAMKALMRDAVFIGFTGTPLRAEDRKTTFEVFGGYIHTYKFSEAVEDKVVLDLVYEARDIEQRLLSKEKVDAWFDAKTGALNEWKKAALREHWGTMQNVLSSKSRMDRVVNDIIFDFSVKPRLSDHRGNAILVASGIHEACKYFELFQKSVFKDRCAVVTSYNPNIQDVTKEETGANSETDRQFIYNRYTELLENVVPHAGKSKTETYEDSVKELFKKQPSAMRLLIVVDKLLTGFDAPHCSYLYIDKSMQDHGLFQAICRTNRLDGEDKAFGNIVDYKDLFKKVENAIAVYSSELDHSAGGADPEVFLQDRIKRGRERLDDALETLALICEPVERPCGDLEHIHYFCGNTEIPEDLAATEPRRVEFYKAVVALVHAYAFIAEDMEAAGYDVGELDRIKSTQQRYLDLREIIRRASGETLELKAYEADMRHLLDTYIQADEPQTISPFGDMPLMELLVKSGIAVVISGLPAGIRNNENAVAETIADNVRTTIIKEHLKNPDYYDRMSELLKAIIDDLKNRRIDYAKYLLKIAELAKQVVIGVDDETPEKLKTPAQRALYYNLYAPAFEARDVGAEYRCDKETATELALVIDETVRRVKPDDFRGNQARENEIKRALLPLLGDDVSEVERLFPIIKQQSEY